MTHYYQRQTCVNGHVISNYIGSDFATPQPFCNKCGAGTIIGCPSCVVPQRGSAVDALLPPKTPPAAFCFNCGKPYPWTTAQLQAATELVKEEEQLSAEDKQTLTNSLPSLIVDVPTTTLAATRVKRIVGQASKSFEDAMYKFLVDTASDTAKKIVLGE